MPELPEVETIRRGLQTAVKGQRITRAHLHRADVCSGPHRCRPADLLQGQRIEELRRHGKQLAIIGDRNRILVVQLGMSGQMRILARRQQAPANHVHATWRLENGSRLIFRDPRRFGGLSPLASLEDLDARWAKLGPDALSITTSQLARNLEGSRRAVKAALLDQEAIAGVGNIYADEALFSARIRPHRLCTSLDRREYQRLAAAIRKTLRVAINWGGSSVRDYAAATGKLGRAQDEHLVYGRSGQPCRRCGTPLKATTVAQRTTVYCPNCQR